MALVAFFIFAAVAMILGNVFMVDREDKPNDKPKQD